MSDEDFEEELEEDLDEDLDEELDEDLDEDLELDDDTLVDDSLSEDESADEDGDDGDEEVAAEATPKRPKGRASDDEEDVLDLEEEHHPDDVEVPLDAILQERTAKASLDDDEEEDEDFEVDDRGEGTTKIVPRRPGEFLCSSCFLVLPNHQLADEKRSLCRDCA